MSYGSVSFQLVEQLHEVVVFDTNMTDAQKASICDRLGVSCVHSLAMQVQVVQ